MLARTAALATAALLLSVASYATWAEFFKYPSSKWHYDRRAGLYSCRLPWGCNKVLSGPWEMEEIKPGAYTLVCLKTECPVHISSADKRRKLSQDTAE